MKKTIYVIVALAAIVILVKLIIPIFIKDNFEENAEQATENWKNEHATKIESTEIKVDDLSIEEYVTIDEAVPADDYVEYRIIN